MFFLASVAFPTRAASDLSDLCKKAEQQIRVVLEGLESASIFGAMKTGTTIAVLSR
ncbi:hypothetical protein BRAS3843_2960007 [Bradyrhizobium sp. STM 3843]|nr:hypothetical protein BRAS3843_2960007 [Bradyrhizobium sp. STM 3843]